MYSLSEIYVWERASVDLLFMTSAWLHSSPVEPNTSATKHTVFMFTIKTVVFSLLFHTSPIFRVALLCTHKVRKTRRRNLALAFLYNFYSLYIISYESLMICVAPGFYRVKVQFPTSGKWMNVNNWCVSLVWGQEWDGARSWLSLKVYDPAGDKGELAVKASFERWWKSILIVKWAAETQLYEVKTYFFLLCRHQIQKQE